MESVESSSVVAVGYDSATNELWIEFEGGSTYAYSLVPPSVHQELLQSGSIGRYVNLTVKPRYAAREV
ncbi:KTSC domain-containing protein [Aeromicrobium panaciterrae]